MVSVKAPLAKGARALSAKPKKDQAASHLIKSGDTTAAVSKSSPKATLAAKKGARTATPSSAAAQRSTKPTRVVSSKTLKKSSDSDVVIAKDEDSEDHSADQSSDIESFSVEGAESDEEDRGVDSEIINGIDSSDGDDSSDEDELKVNDKKKVASKAANKSKAAQVSSTPKLDEIQQGDSLVLLNPDDLVKLKNSTKKVNSNPKAEPGVVYLGHVPHGFYEAEMMSYFSQFGEVTRLRLSRNKKTGRSKHYAFIEFKDAEVAKIVSDTMNNYLMFNQIIKCKLVAAEKLHVDTFKGCNRKFKVVPWNKVQRQKQNKPKTLEQWSANTKRLEKNDVKKRKHLESLGIEYEFPGYAGAALAQKGKLSSTEKTSKKPKKAGDEK
ncbi:hypothetical protein BASA83_009908 [Batrachochytrium salamandrivorans]|nr:hypothetical protein BASA62_004851 [Batrachochytrium salamandrivorans]KAH9252680.1 hypothetical protein BASA81_009372 [Batrachochytrium salamandrivorans]KAH9267518.1 hypothetical protein BASA83_009908 [Batrachochytrium salamandrivorans]